MLGKNALRRLAVAGFVTTQSLLVGSGHSDPQPGAAGEKRPISMQHQGRAIPNTLEEIVDPAHTVVIVHEMIGDIVARYKSVAVQTLTRAWYLGYFRVAVSDATLSGKPARAPFTTTYLNSALPRTSGELVDIWSRHPAPLR